MHHALAKLRAKKLLFDDVYPAIDYAAQPQPVYVTSHEARAVSPPPGSRPDDLAILLGQIALQEEAIAASRRIIEARRDMLQRAIANAEALQPAAVVEIATEVTGKKSKKPKKPSTVDTRACGYDWRLSADDAEILALLESEVKDADTEVCSASRRCDRHQGWQKTLAVELEVELALNVSVVMMWTNLGVSKKRPAGKSNEKNQKWSRTESESKGHFVSRDACLGFELTMASELPFKLREVLQ